jgi:hypothetical protein
MTIEVRQMIIKSTLVSGRREQESQRAANIDLEALKQEVMEECRELIERSLNELQER